MIMLKDFYGGLFVYACKHLSLTLNSILSNSSTNLKGMPERCTLKGGLRECLNVLE